MLKAADGDMQCRVLATVTAAANAARDAKESDLAGSGRTFLLDGILEI